MTPTENFFLKTESPALWYDFQIAVRLCYRSLDCHLVEGFDIISHAGSIVISLY